MGMSLLFLTVILLVIDNSYLFGDPPSRFPMDCSVSGGDSITAASWPFFCINFVHSKTNKYHTTQGSLINKRPIIWP